MVAADVSAARLGHDTSVMGRNGYCRSAGCGNMKWRAPYRVWASHDAATNAEENPTRPVHPRPWR